MNGDAGRLRRWEESGANWRIIARTGDGLVIALLTCDAGEEVDRFQSADPDLLRYVGGRDRSGAPAPGDNGGRDPIGN